MFLRYGILFSVFVLVLYSCSNNNQFPPKYFEKADSESVVLNQSFIAKQKSEISNSLQSQDFEKQLNELTLYKRFYDERNTNFNLANLETLWSKLKSQSNEFNLEGLTQWIEITGFLLEITGNGIYAGELEETVYRSSELFSESDFKEIEKLVVPWIFTKNVDHIHVNLFANSTIQYDHTLKGAVEITQETLYPESGKIQIKFKMEKKRYIELFIRIPEWAEGATVTEWRVKYVATPGEYCQIVRKWSDGDFVEIILPVEKLPQFPIASN